MSFLHDAARSGYTVVNERLMQSHQGVIRKEMAVPANLSTMMSDGKNRGAKKRKMMGLTFSA